MATSNDGTRHKGHILRLGTDLGTGHLSVDGQHVQGGPLLNHFPLRFKNRYGGTSVKQIAIHQEGQDSPVIYGFDDVTNAVRCYPGLRDKEIERFKLSLHPEFAGLSEVQHAINVLEAQEDRGPIQDFMSDFFQTFLQDVRIFYMRYHHAGMDEAYWKSIPIELQISVPATWDDDARGIIRNAAKYGGAWRAELREESLCVATAYLVSMVEERSIKAGECLLLIDCGQGTLDIATVKLSRKPHEQELMQLERVGVCSGNSAGSHEVNTAAEKWLRLGNCMEVQARGFKETCRQLGMSERQFLRAYSDEIDKVKVDIDRQTVFDLRVHSLHGKVMPGSLSQLTISIPRTTFMEWYKTWTDPAVGLLERHLSTQSGHTPGQYAWALFTGGGANSPHFCREMEKVLSKYSILVGNPRPVISPCSSGALLQHFFQDDGLPPNAYFHICQTEDYDKYKHLGAVGHKLKRRSEFVRGLEVVHDRVVTIGQSSNQQQFTSKGLFKQEFHVDALRPGRVHVDLFWSEKYLRAHSALKDAHGKHVDGVRKYPLMYIDVVDLTNHGFELHDDDGNGDNPYYVVQAFVHMESTRDSLLLTLYLMQWGFLLPTKAVKNEVTDGYDVQPFDDSYVLQQHTEEVWRKDCSHFVTSNTVSRPHSQPTRQGGAMPNKRARRS